MARGGGCTSLAPLSHGGRSHDVTLPSGAIGSSDSGRERGGRKSPAEMFELM